MEWLKNIEWTPLNILKGLGIVLAALIVLSITARIVQPLTGVVLPNARELSLVAPTAPVADPSYNRALYDGGRGYGDVDEAAYSVGQAKLSLTNIGVPTPPVGGTVGNDAESYEVTRYTVLIETRNSDRTCGEVSALKQHDYVIFENANEHDSGCYYTFKVAHERVADVLAVIERLQPRQLSESTHTIKQQLDDFTSETEILERKLETIEATLESALTAYEEITTLASNTHDAESLARVINSKISTIERLTNERINITAQLERLARAKAEQLDRLEYTYFNVDVYENKFVDFESIQQSWKNAVKNFVFDINQTAQDITINFISFLFMIVQYVLYFFVLLFIAKYLWRTAQHIWGK